MPAALATRDEVPTHRRQRRALITGVLAPPLLWFAHLQINYALASWACRPGHRFVSIVVVVTAIVMSAGAGALAWQVWPRDEPLAGEPQRIEGARLLALLALGSSLSFVVVLVATAIPLFMQRACD
jgi:hypothetical protein